MSIDYISKARSHGLFGDIRLHPRYILDIESLLSHPNLFLSSHGISLGFLKEVQLIEKNAHRPVIEGVGQGR